jgi:large subunit ribosomal protein L4
VGGGRIHTPHPRSYEQKMPKKMRQAALRSALSAKAAEAGVVVVDDFVISEAKTRLMVETLNNLVGKSSALVLLPEKDQTYEQVTRTTNNLSAAKVLLASYLNIRDLFGYEKLILPVKALDALVATLG